MNYETLQHGIALTFIPGIGAINAKTLVSYCGDPATALKAKKSALMKIPGVGIKQAEAIINHRLRALERAERELLFIEEQKLQVCFYFEPAYPRRLKTCSDAPLLLYQKGRTNLNEARIISVVGTRNATRYGKKLCYQLIETLAAYEPLVISGLAYGVDYTTHQACVDNQVPTIGVLAHGLDRIYPAQHTLLAKQMTEQGGGLLSELPSGTFPDRCNFPMRNRIVAGMSDATIIVETANKGGSMITANLANSYHRDVFAFPGRINDKWSSGCNLLIKHSKAELILSPKEIPSQLGWEKTVDSKAGIQKQLFVELTDEEEKVVRLLKVFPECPIDRLNSSLELSSSRIAALLLSLELKGVVQALPGSLWGLC